MEKMHNLIAAVGGMILFMVFPAVCGKGMINIGNRTGMLVAGLVLSYAVFPMRNYTRK